jgi:hypothetical protein
MPFVHRVIASNSKITLLYHTALIITSYFAHQYNPDKGYTADKLSANGLRVKRYSENQNKHLKISTYLFEVWRRLEWAPETDDEYMNQVMDYRERSEPDDAPDSAASLFKEAFSKEGAVRMARWEM